MPPELGHISALPRNSVRMPSFFSLAIWDSLLIVDMLIQKAIVGNFLKEEPLWFKMSYPYFWHPIKGMVKNGTIFMVVAVSAERYRAICHPLRKRQVNFESVLASII